MKSNFASLGVCNAVFNSFCIEPGESGWAEALRAFRPDVIYLDPARRNAAGHKVFLLEDCSPDVTTLLPALLEIAPQVIIKVSPMADLTMLRRRLEGFLESVHVVGAGGECKELLCICRKDAAFTGVVLSEDGRPYTGSSARKVPPETSASLHPSRCASLAGPSHSRGHGRPRFPETPSDSAAPVYGLLFVPSAAMVKSGLGPGMCLMGYDEQLAHFGKFWQVVENLPFASSEIKRLGRRWPRAEVTARGVPVSSEELRKKIGTKPGGPVHIFACILGGERRLLVCKQMPGPE